MGLRSMRHSERTAACLSHLAGLIPLWGALVMAAVYWQYRGRSRPVLFHVHQAVFFHVTMLLLLTIPLLVYALGRMAGVLRPQVGELVSEIGFWGAMGVLAVNTVMVTVAANATIDGRHFQYPFFGKRLRPGFEEPPVVRSQREFHTYLTPAQPASVADKNPAAVASAVAAATAAAMAANPALLPPQPTPAPMPVAKPSELASAEPGASVPAAESAATAATGGDAAVAPAPTDAEKPR